MFPQVTMLDATTPGGFLLVLSVAVPIAGVLLAFVAGGRQVERIALLVMPIGLAVALGAAVAMSRIGGPLVYLIGVISFKRSLRGWFQLSHIAGILALVALIPFAERCSPLALGALCTLVLLIVAIWETLSLRNTPTADVGGGEEIED